MNKHRIILAAIMAGTVLPAVAQTTLGGYFTDGFLYRHQMNPALSNDESYFSMPALGNINVAQRGDLGLGDLLFVANGKTVTFMHPDVSISDALKNVQSTNRMDNNMRVEILSWGKRMNKGYLTFDLGLRTDVGVSLPGAFFRLAKEGPANQSYDLSHIEIYGQGYGELAIGYSHRVNRNLEVGGKVKLLAGIANVHGQADDVHLTLANDHWEASVEAEVDASMKGLKYKCDDPQTKMIDGIDMDGGGVSGFGVAFDLGASYRINDDWRVDLALLDLGFLSWSNNHLASTDGRRTLNTQSYIFNVDGDASNAFGDELDRLTEDLGDLFKFKDMGDKGSRTTGLAATLNVGAEYRIPVYSELSVGALSSTRFAALGAWTEFRLSANYAPCHWFSMSVSGAAGTFGPSFGWLLNLHPRGFNLFAGMDSMGAPFTSDGIPCARNAHMNIGINFPLK